MAQLEILYLLLCLFAGMVSFGIVCYVHLSKRVGGLRPFLTAYATFTALYATGLTTSYISANLPEWKGAVWYVLLYVENPILLIALIAVVPPFIHSLVLDRQFTLDDRFFYWAALATYAAHVGIAAVGSNFPYSAMANMVKNGVVGIMVVYCAVLLIRARYHRWLVVGLGAFILHDVFLVRYDGLRFYPLVYTIIGVVMVRYYHALDGQHRPVASIDVADLASYGLSSREIEVVALLLEGKSYRDVADLLFISLNTVKAHVRNIYPKLQVNSRHEMVALLRSPTPTS